VVGGVVVAVVGVVVIVVVVVVIWVGEVVRAVNLVVVGAVGVVVPDVEVEISTEVVFVSLPLSVFVFLSPLLSPQAKRQVNIIIPKTKTTPQIIKIRFIVNSPLCFLYEW
jgi:hypothetical protein